MVNCARNVEQLLHQTEEPDGPFLARVELHLLLEIQETAILTRDARWGVQGCALCTVDST